VMLLALVGLFAAFLLAKVARAEVGFVQGEIGGPCSIRGSAAVRHKLRGPVRAGTDDGHLQWASPDTLVGLHALERERGDIAKGSGS